MANYTYAQLEGLWIQNGGSAATAPIAAAIAEAESGGNPAATSSNPDGGTNSGLWQLDTKGKGAGLTATQLQDPNVNASAAVEGSANGTDWSAWETYANGAYKAFLNTSSTPSTSGLPTSANTVTAASAAANANVCIIPYPTINVVVTTVGGGCILTKSQGRAIIGGACLAVAGVVALAAAVILAAAAFEKTGAASAVAQAVPPVRAVTRAAGRVGPKA